MKESTVKVSLDKDSYEKLKKIADSKGLTVSQVISSIVRKFLKSQEEEKKR